MQRFFRTGNQELIDTHDYPELFDHWATIHVESGLASIRPLFLRVLEGNDSPRTAAICRALHWSLWVDEFEGELLRQFDCFFWKSFLASLAAIAEICITLYFAIKKPSIKPDFLLRFLFSRGPPGKKHLFKTSLSLRRVLFGSDIL